MTRRDRPLWRRPAWAGLFALLALNLAGLLAFTLPRSVSARQMDAHVLELEAQLEAQRLESAQRQQRRQLLQQNARDAQRLLERLVGRREATLVPVLAEVERHASELGVVTGSATMSPGELKDTPLTRLGITMPLEGSYSGLVGFLRRLERSKTFLTVDSLKLSQRDEGKAGGTKLDIKLSAYFSSAPGEAGGRGGKRGR